jgi:protease-4
MIAFLRGVASTIVGIFIFGVLLVFIGAAIIGALASDDEVEVKNNSVLHLRIDKPIVERAADDPLTAAELFPGADGGSIGLVELLEAIRHAQEDDNIEGIYLEPLFLSGGFASIKEIRDQLQEFKASGKWVVAYSELYTEKDFYLASVADRLYLNPSGELEFNGLVSDVIFFKGTLEKLGIEPQIFRVGDYKSAVEPFMRKDMSEASREQITSFLNSIYNSMLADISQTRNIALEDLERISDEMSIRRPEDAVKLNIVDQLAYEDEVLSSIKDQLEIDQDDEIDFISYKKYRKAIKPAAGNRNNRIAVIVAQGEIVSGEGDRTSIGSDVFAKEIRKAREDDKVKAIVLRVNSPGGSALASDVIWREVQLAAQTKPIIASMGDLAASGGYYISMACDTIVAEPTTITGSIGIFGMIPNMQEFLNDKLGITTESVETGELSNLFKVSKPLTEYEKSIVQQSVEEGYDDFTRKAAEGRSMTVEALREVASGRVWSGIEAKDRGLVDILGDFDDAIQIAAQKAGLEKDDYSVRYYPKQKNFLEEIVGKLEDDMEAKSMQAQFGPLYPYVNQLRQINNYRGIQARMPYELDIH